MPDIYKGWSGPVDYASAGCVKRNVGLGMSVGENIIATIKMRNNFLYSPENGSFSNFAMAILDFSLLLPIYLVIALLTLR